MDRIERLIIDLVENGLTASLLVHDDVHQVHQAIFANCPEEA